MNKFIGIGALTKAVEVRYTKNELKVANFTLAINREVKNKEGNYDADYINCVAYGNQADLVSKYLDKGSKVSVEGHIQTGSYEKDGKKIYTTDIVVEKLTFLEKKQETTQTEIVQKAMSDNPYETMGQQVQMDNEGLPF